MSNNNLKPFSGSLLHLEQILNPYHALQSCNYSSPFLAPKLYFIAVFQSHWSSFRSSKMSNSFNLRYIAQALPSAWKALSPPLHLTESISTFLSRLTCQSIKWAFPDHPIRGRKHWVPPQQKPASTFFFANTTVILFKDMTIMWSGEVGPFPVSNGGS